MARPKIPASVIAQRGKKITLLDDSEAAIVFTFSSLMRIEEEFGSVQGALTEVAKGESSASFTALARLIATGLEHETTEDGYPLSDVETLRTLLDSARFDSYSDALGEALALAFPNADDEAGEGGEDPQKGSRGGTGTTSRQ